MRKRVCGVKSSRSPRISVGSFTEFIFNEVALSHARWSSQNFRETYHDPPWPRQRSSSNYSLSLSFRREKKSEIRVAEGKLRNRIGKEYNGECKNSSVPFSLFWKVPLEEYKTTRVHDQDSFASFERS